MNITHSFDHLEISAELRNDNIFEWLADFFYLFGRDAQRSVTTSDYGSNSYTKVEHRINPERKIGRHQVHIVFDGKTRTFTFLDRGARVECPFDRLTGVRVQQSGNALTLVISVHAGERRFKLGQVDDPTVAETIEKYAREVIDGSQPGRYGKMEPADW